MNASHTAHVTAQGKARKSGIARHVTNIFFDEPMSTTILSEPPQLWHTQEQLCRRGCACCGRGCALTIVLMMRNDPVY